MHPWVICANAELEGNVFKAVDRAGNHVYGGENHPSSKKKALDRHL
jgi:hypothetical protein